MSNSKQDTHDEAFSPEGHGEEASWSVFLSLMPWLWQPGNRVRVGIVCGLLVAGKLLAVVVPLAYQRVVDALIPMPTDTAMTRQDWLEALQWAPVALIVVYGAIKLSSALSGELRDALFARVGQHAVRSLSTTAFNHIHGLSLRYHLDRRTGGLARVLERGLEGIQIILQFFLFSIGPTVIEFSFALFVIGSVFGSQYALVICMIVVSYVVATVMLTRWRIILRRQMNDANEISSSRAVDSLLNWETVQCFSNRAYETSRYDDSMARYERAATRSQTSLALLNSVQQTIIVGGEVVLLVLAARAVMGGELTLGGLVAIMSYLVQLYRPLNVLGFAYRQIRTALTDIEKLFALLLLQSEIQDRPDARPIQVKTGRVDFRAVDFSYDGRRRILHQVDFSVPAGHSVAIVGPTGSGKSTLARLLFRFYDVSDGGILIDGIDIRDFTQASLRRAIGIVPQDTVMFNDTVAYNISYGRIGADMAEIQRAAKAAALHDFIASLPDGYHTRVGERGLKLSGGERQRLAIARTILKDPAILVLDEASSALDSHAEREIQANIRELFADRTLVSIAHRLSTIVDADEIIVLEQGRIIERGNHEALLTQQGLYTALWRTQSETDTRSGIRDSDR